MWSPRAFLPRIGEYWKVFNHPGSHEFNHDHCGWESVREANQDWRKLSNVYNKSDFEANLDSRQFKSNEFKVTMDDGNEQSDNHGKHEGNHYKLSYQKQPIKTDIRGWFP